jgi:surface protein
MTIITDDNIHELVSRYIHELSNGRINDDELPEDLINVRIGDWDVSRVTNMDFLFVERHFDEPIGGWDVSNVTSMEGMFQDTASFNQPIGGWDVSKVKNMSSMFAGGSGSFNQPIGGWDVSKVKNMSSMFASTKAFNQPIGDWDVSSVKNMSEMFSDARSFNQPIGGWDVSKVENMSSMFRSAESFNQPIGDWDVSSVKNMSEMFSDARSFNQPIEQWDVSNVENMRGMFHDAESFSQSLARWGVPLLELFANEEHLKEYIERVNSNIAIARTTKEYMAMCLTSTKTADECMETECPVCTNQFMSNGVLNRPVMFHKTAIRRKNGTEKEIWSCPVHDDEQVTWGQMHGGECVMCRQKVFIPKLQKDDIMRKAREAYAREEYHRKAATKIQSVTRGHQTRKTNKKVVQLAYNNAKQKFVSHWYGPRNKGGSKNKKNHVRNVKMLRKTRRTRK